MCVCVCVRVRVCAHMPMHTCLHSCVCMCARLLCLSGVVHACAGPYLQAQYVRVPLGPLTAWASQTAPCPTETENGEQSASYSP